MNLYNVLRLFYCFVLHEVEWCEKKVWCWKKIVRKSAAMTLENTATILRTLYTERECSYYDNEGDLCGLGELRRSLAELLSTKDQVEKG